MQLDQLHYGDVLSVRKAGQLFVAMYLGKISPRSSSHMAAQVTIEGLVCFSLEEDIQEITEAYRYHDNFIAEKAGDRVLGWLRQRIPYDEARHSSSNDQSIQEAQSAFKTAGFFNVIKFFLNLSFI